MSETIEIQYPYWVFTFLLNFEIFYNFFFKKWRNSQNSIRQRMRSKWINVKKRCLRRTGDTNFNKKVKKINKKKAFGDDSYPHTRLCVFFEILQKKYCSVQYRVEENHQKCYFFHENRWFSLTSTNSHWWATFWSCLKRNELMFPPYIRTLNSNIFQPISDLGRTKSIRSWKTRKVMYFQPS